MSSIKRKILKISRIIVIIGIIQTFLVCSSSDSVSDHVIMVKAVLSAVFLAQYPFVRTIVTNQTRYYLWTAMHIGRGVKRRISYSYWFRKANRVLLYRVRAITARRTNKTLPEKYVSTKEVFKN